MIISASRRTDIPAFYSHWFMKRVKAGFVDVINPFNRLQVSRVSLQPKDVDCIVFWTKNAEPMFPYLATLDRLGYKYYFQFTITPYGTEIEPGIGEKGKIVQIFQKLSQILGKKRVVLRYDPIFITSRYTIAWHVKAFKRLMALLSTYTDCCVISFLDFYKRNSRNLTYLQIKPMNEGEMKKIAAQFSKIAQDYAVPLQTCAEAIDLKSYGILHGACIDRKHIEQAMGCQVEIKKDTTQRPFCGCMKSVDIGQYNTCRHFCKYCYANFNQQVTAVSCQEHDDDSTLLSGKLRGDEKINWRKIEHVKIFPDQSEMYSLF